MITNLLQVNEKRCNIGVVNRIHKENDEWIIKRKHKSALGIQA